MLKHLGEGCKPEIILLASREAIVVEQQRTKTQIELGIPKKRKVIGVALQRDGQGDFFSEESMMCEGWRDSSMNCMPIQFFKLYLID